jgi:hypothetical protein
MIVGIVGRTVGEDGSMCSLGTGKDTVADALADEHSFVKVALADPMKRFCQDVYGFSRDQLWGPSSSRNAPDERYPREHTFLGPEEKKGICACCGWAYVPDYKLQCYLTPRYALQTLGTEWGRDCFNDTWAGYGMETARQLLFAYEMPKTHDHWSYVPWLGLIESNIAHEYGVLRASETKGVVFSDVRFKNEVEYIKKRGGKVILVVRNVEAAGSGMNIQHQSENDLNNIPADDPMWNQVIHNDAGVEDLVPKTKQALEALRGTV